MAYLYLTIGHEVLCSTSSSLYSDLVFHTKSLREATSELLALGTSE